MVQWFILVWIVVINAVIFEKCGIFTFGFVWKSALTTAKTNIFETKIES